MVVCLVCEFYEYLPLVPKIAYRHIGTFTYAPTFTYSMYVQYVCTHTHTHIYTHTHTYIHTHTHTHTHRVIQKDGLNCTVNGASTHARQLVVVFQVLCSLYGLTCMGYAQIFLEFISRSPLIHAKILVLYSSRFALN